MKILRLHINPPLFLHACTWRFCPRDISPAAPTDKPPGADSFCPDLLPVVNEDHWLLLSVSSSLQFIEPAGIVFARLKSNIKETHRKGWGKNAELYSKQPKTKQFGTFVSWRPPHNPAYNQKLSSASRLCPFPSCIWGVALFLVVQFSCWALPNITFEKAPSGSEPTSADQLWSERLCFCWRHWEHTHVEWGLNAGPSTCDSLPARLNTPLRSWSKMLQPEFWQELAGEIVLLLSWFHFTSFQKKPPKTYRIGLKNNSPNRQGP